jgi:DNA-binding CsgD family transcriptional regulator
VNAISEIVPEAIEIDVSAVIFRKDLYPRIEHSATTVQQYATDLDVLPPIEVNQHFELIDGWHRWTAHKKVGAERIKAIVRQTASDTAFLECAIAANATHGLQLSLRDKQDMARHIYAMTPESERGEKKKRLAAILSVSERTVRDWLSRIDKDAKEKRNERIFDLWMACYTQAEIADAVNCSEQPVKDVISDISANLPENLKPAANHQTDFEPPIYNVWKQQTKTEGTSHFGNSEVRWVDNLLYLYTQPFDVVVDPFAGGGSTIDICKKRFRRYFVSDRKPVPERADQIREHDLTTGVPKAPWKDVKLVYLDPPYWIQAAGQYSDDPTDLANMPLDEFNKSLAGVINGYAAKLSPGAVIALIIQPTQWKAPDRQYTDHVADMIKAVKLPLDLRISAPYESQQCNAQMVNWAKANRKVLVLSREIIVWKVPG